MLLLMNTNCPTAHILVASYGNLLFVPGVCSGAISKAWMESNTDVMNVLRFPWSMKAPHSFIPPGTRS